jgi:uncharacterized repeat protein (TIGR03803 family)
MKVRIIRHCIILLTSLALTLTASAQWQESVLYSFQGGTDGQWPLGSVVFDADGNLYGVTEAGGANTCTSYGNCGTVYQLAPPMQPGAPWVETVLHIFQGHTAGDASDPLGGLVIDTNGNLYGATGGGGTGNCEILGTFPGCGAVYELSPPTVKGGAWVERVLYSFQGGTDGAFPYGDIVFDNAGNLYGATLYGGGYGTQCGDTFYVSCGTVFELSPPKVKGEQWTEQVLARFRGLTPGKQYGDGANPNGGLLIDKAGAIYGTTQIGGFDCQHSSNYGCGIAYRLDPPTEEGEPWTRTYLHVFTSGADGSLPNGGLVFDHYGDLYGTMPGGTGAYGSIFHLVAHPGDKWTNHIVFNFNDGYSGGLPRTGFVIDSKGNLYGTTSSGGANGSGGTLFEMASEAVASTLPVKVLHAFLGDPDGYYPDGNLIFDAAGDIFGTTQQGGTGTCYPHGCGTIFEAVP